MKLLALVFYQRLWYLKFSKKQDRQDYPYAPPNKPRDFRIRSERVNDNSYKVIETRKDRFKTIESCRMRFTARRGRIKKLGLIEKLL